jgi:hypothetical protein
MVGCASDGTIGASAAASGGDSVEALSFADVAQTEGVPRDLLVAIAAVEGGIGMPAQRDVREEVEVPAAGPLMLRRGQLDTLALGAKLANTSEWAIRKDTQLGLQAGARVVAELSRTHGAQSSDYASYADMLKELSGYADELHRNDYAQRVFATLSRGGDFAGRDGKTVHLAPHDLPPTLLFDYSAQLKTLAGVEYPGALYFPIPAAKQAGKLTVGRGGAKVEYVVVHDTEGGWDGSVATLQNDPGKSVQYIIDVDGRVGQFMSEADTGYHAGNFYYNQRSVGIEHVGYSTKAYPTKQYEVSAKLVKHLATKYVLPLNRTRIIGHDQIPDGGRIDPASAPCSLSPKACGATSNYGGAANHGDPGVWEWARLMYLAGGSAKVNDVTPLWNCSSDNNFAFRSNAGKVEVLECKTCTVMALGVDDVCDPKTPPPVPTGTGTVPPPPPPPGVDAGPAADAGSTPPPVGGVDPSPQPPSSGCCAQTPHTMAPSGLALLGVVAFAAAFLRRRNSNH